ncbi:flagellar basal-body MS-ring/collar protein FliF [Cereibacter sphaeroides]|uniref:flagellar basal-body MS-ring/collar protein FliF n=1 Tax=Cereibacter sphaeroides TaxID=1063 RepID=UPI0002FACE19|nr:flagellar basal-body MS-ring/collar protein FliF [Cereibacter sphaeroides]
MDGRARQKPVSETEVQNLISIWNDLDGRRRAVVVGATVAMFLAVLGLSQLAGRPPMALLYAGLQGAAAGEVVTALEAQGAAYEVRGDSVYVEAARRDEIRMKLAGEGLPATGAAGYELLDGLSGFGTTSQMFDAAYLRAKEGELARTILASPQVKAARVHIAQPAAQPFQREQRPTASVTVTTSGGAVTANQARAFKHLVASAVAGLQPEDVSVIDSVMGLIRSGDEKDSATAAGESRAAELRSNVERLLEARAGPGRAVVEVSVDVETARESIVEKSFDPKGRVPISSETQEKSSNSTEPSPDVTVASNLPEGDAKGGTGGKSSTSETRETVNFEVSQTQRELMRQPGAIRRLTVAVLVDGIKTVADDGTVGWEPRPEEELAVLRELVGSAVGLDESRGDRLTLRSLAFETPPEAGTLAETGFLSRLGAFDLMSLIQIGVLALVALILGLFVVRPVLTAPPRPPAAPQPLALPGYEGGEPALTGEIDDSGDLPDFPMVSSAPLDLDEEADPVARLRRLIEERQAESVEILRGWMEPQREAP